MVDLRFSSQRRTRSACFADRPLLSSPQSSPLHQSSSTGNFRQPAAADADLMGDWGSTLTAPQAGAMHRNASQPNLRTAAGQRPQPQQQQSPVKDPFADLGQSVK